MNRRLRRALERAAKKTHKLEPQACVLWVPSARGYLVRFGAEGFTTVERADLAQQFCEHYASSAAVAFWELTDLRVEVRPYVEHRQGWRGAIAAAQLQDSLS